MTEQPRDQSVHQSSVSAPAGDGVSSVRTVAGHTTRAGMATGDGTAVLAISAPPIHRRNPLTRSPASVAGLVVLGLMVLISLGTMPWTLGWVGKGTPPFRATSLDAVLLPPGWVPAAEDEQARLAIEATNRAKAKLAAESGVSIEEAPDPTPEQIEKAKPFYWLGTDALGRSLMVRLLAGGGVSIGIGMAAALISVTIGTLYGSLAAYIGGRVDAVMMRIVDVLYGLPYVLLVVLLAVAGDAVISEVVSKQSARQNAAVQLAAPEAEARGIEPTKLRILEMIRQDPELDAEIRARLDADPRLQPRRVSQGTLMVWEVVVLLVAIGGVSWLTMARVIRGQVLSLKAQPFMEAARAMGVPAWRQFLRHLLPNLVGPIIVYATLTVPQAILQESFLSFLGIGVKQPLPSWGNLAAEGLKELNPIRVRWWLIACPCAVLALTLLALNFVGEGLREAFDPKRART
jgi:oligopeptide transport system permease protein